MASADLGPLGAKDGPPVAYHWDLPSVAPRVLPWLVILGLLALKPNRNGAAWLIWLPLACALGLIGLLPGLPSPVDFLRDVMAAFVFGVAAVWLLATYLRGGHQLLTFFRMLICLGALALAAWLVRQGGDFGGGEEFAGMAVLGIGVLATVVALTASGWLCRRRFSPAKLDLCLLFSLTVIWLAVFAPFLLAAMAGSGGQPAWSEVWGPITAVIGVHFGLLLPFLILSSANLFYRDRLELLLHVQSAPPPLAVPPVPATALTAESPINAEKTEGPPP